MPPEPRGTAAQSDAAAQPIAAVAGSLRVTETFNSRQGEGILTGTPSHFIRLAGCNLRCWFCDTRYASWHPEGTRQSVQQLVERATASGCQHVVLTGGEPLLPAGVGQLCHALRCQGLHLTIETAGTVDRPIACDLLSVSPKLAGSGPDPSSAGWRWARLHEQRRWQPRAVAALIRRSDAYQVKFVVDSPQDCNEVLGAVRDLAVPADHVWIMPQATAPEHLDGQSQWLAPWSADHGFHYCDRMHLRWYGARRGT